MGADPYRDSIHIAAEPEAVFDYFTNATALARWMGDRAQHEHGDGARVFGIEAPSAKKCAYPEPNNCDRPCRRC